MTTTLEDRPATARAGTTAAAGADETAEGAAGVTDDVAPGPAGGAGQDAPASRWAALGGDAGMATAEYAIATVAAAGFAGLLLLILRSDEVRNLLLGIVRGALSV